MLKKITSLGLMLVMMLSFTACGPKTQIVLEDYKADAKLELETYAEDKGQYNFTPLEWEEILNIVDNAKAAIDAATNKDGVDSVKKETKQAIDEIEQEVLEGHKEVAKSNLEYFAQEKGEGNYNPTDWAKIAQLVEEGKKNIDKAKDKKEISDVGLATRNAIALIPKDVQLEPYKETIKTKLEEYFAKKRQEAYTEENWAIIQQIVVDGKGAIDQAEDIESVDFAYDAAKELMDEVEHIGNDVLFPSVIENFKLENFTEEFFENNSLVLLRFEHPYLLRDYLEFYTVAAINGKLNFYLEVTDPLGGGDQQLDGRRFVVTIPKEVANAYEIGEMIVFHKYEYRFDNPPHVENSREWLKEIDEQTVNHRVGYLPNVIFNFYVDIFVISTFTEMQNSISSQ